MEEGKYRRMENTISKVPLLENEIRVTKFKSVTPVMNKIKSYLETYRTVYIKAIGQATSKALLAIEITKRSVPDVYQMNELSTMERDDEYEPLEEGLDAVSIKRTLTCLCVTLSLDPLDTSHYGYQEPLDAIMFTGTCYVFFLYF